MAYYSKIPGTINQNYNNIDWYYIADTSFNQKPKYLLNIDIVCVLFLILPGFVDDDDYIFLSMYVAKVRNADAAYLESCCKIQSEF